jgi:hypothetical protein
MIGFHVSLYFMNCSKDIVNQYHYKIRVSAWSFLYNNNNQSLMPYPTQWGRLHVSNNAITSIIYHIFIQLINLSIFLNSIFYCFSWSSSASSDLTTLHVIYSPYYIIHRSSLYMPKPPKPSLHHLF